MYHEKEKHSLNWTEYDINEANKFDHNDQRIENLSFDFSCSFCKDNFDIKEAVMKHKKNKHVEHVSTCWKYSSKMCPFENEKCWFVHDETKTSGYSCNLCEKDFAILPD